MTTIADTQPVAETNPAPVNGAVTASPFETSGATDATPAQPIDDTLPVPVAVQLREMNVARAAVAQAAALLLQPASNVHRTREQLRSAEADAEVISELRRALRELRRIK
jgi:hypothetical protein